MSMLFSSVFSGLLSKISEAILQFVLALLGLG